MNRQRYIFLYLAIFFFVMISILIVTNLPSLMHATSFDRSVGYNVKKTDAIDQTNAVDYDTNLDSDNSQIEFLMTIVEQSDIKLGRGILSEKDLRYLLELSDGGLTTDDKKNLESYFKLNLSESDYEIIYSLYNKYIGLIKK